MNKTMVAKELLRVAKDLVSARPENDRMQRYMRGLGFGTVKAKYIHDGSLRGVWSLVFMDKVWDDEMVEQMTDLGFMDSSNRPLDQYSARGDSTGFQIFVKGHDEMLGEESEELIYNVPKEKKEKEVRHGFKIGDILYTSWGYDQTNVDYFQVVAVTAGGVKIRAILSTQVDAEHVKPRAGFFTGEAMTKRVSPSGSVRINSFSHAYKWEGKPNYVTPFGMGH